MCSPQQPALLIGGRVGDKVMSPSYSHPFWCSLCHYHWSAVAMTVLTLFTGAQVEGDSLHSTPRIIAPTIELLGNNLGRQEGVSGAEADRPGQPHRGSMPYSLKWCSRLHSPCEFREAFCFSGVECLYPGP